MQCHFCDREADVGVEHGGVTVGVCEEHFRERVEELADTTTLQDIGTSEDR